ncbi:hypothetical protein [Acetoanaerobium sticklandii]|uniref:hypothetical protein n=1 Tax=Acetoanaerobium sticklandii TaxID=1511 RepID=UPI003A8E32E5
MIKEFRKIEKVQNRQCTDFEVEIVKSTRLKVNKIKILDNKLNTSGISKDKIMEIKISKGFIRTENVATLESSVQEQHKFTSEDSINGKYYESRNSPSILKP